MTKPSNVREFFYVDVERARSLLAQIDRGVVDAVIKRTASSLEAEAGARVFGIGGSGGYSRETSREESRSFQDLTYVVFEERADEKGFIEDLSGNVLSTDAWEEGRVHQGLSEGQIVRISSDVQVLDTEFFVARLKRLNEFADAWNELAPAGLLRARSSSEPRT